MYLRVQSSEDFKLYFDRATVNAFLRACYEISQCKGTVVCIFTHGLRHRVIAGDSRIPGGCCTNRNTVDGVMAAHHSSCLPCRDIALEPVPAAAPTLAPSMGAADPVERAPEPAWEASGSAAAVCGSPGGAAVASSLRKADA